MLISRPGDPTGIKDGTSVYSLLPVHWGGGGRGGGGRVSSHRHMLPCLDVLALPEAQIQPSQRLLLFQVEDSCQCDTG